MTRRVLVIHNPAAGRGKGNLAERTLAAAQRDGIEIELRETSGPGETRRLAGEASSADWDVIAASGGDGTVNEVLNGMADFALALAVIPSGTANVLATEIGVPRNPDALARMLGHGPIRKAGFGLANGRRFILMAGAGFDARVVAGIDAMCKKKLGRWAYVLQALSESFRVPDSPLRISIDGREITGASAVIAKARHYGGPFLLAPEGGLGQPGFQAVILQGAGPWNMLRYGIGLLRGNLGKFPDVVIARAGEVTISRPEGEPVQIDGDPAGELPLAIRPGDKQLLLLYP